MKDAAGTQQNRDAQDGAQQSEHDVCFLVKSLAITTNAQMCLTQ